MVVRKAFIKARKQDTKDIVRDTLQCLIDDRHVLVSIQPRIVGNTSRQDRDSLNDDADVACTACHKPQEAG